MIAFASAVPLIIIAAILSTVKTTSGTVSPLHQSGSSSGVANSMGENPSFDGRGTLSRNAAREVYDAFAQKDDTVAGKDVDSGYGGPAVTALIEMADFGRAKTVLEYGCGQGKLVELVFRQLQEQSEKNGESDKKSLFWRGIDQSPDMIRRFEERNGNHKEGDNDGKGFSYICRAELLESGDPCDVEILKPKSYDRFVSTYCLDLLSEEDMYKVLDLAESSLHPETGRLLLAGITWGYRDSVQTCLMTAIWELLYRVHRKKVGGCRPQLLQPYLESRGWRIEKVVRTLPNGYPWMVSEVIAAKPPIRKTQ